MSSVKQFLVFLILISVPTILWAKEACYIDTKLPNSKSVSTLVFNDKYLICADSSQIKALSSDKTVFNKNELTLIKGNINEIKHNTIIAHAHGYSLIKGPFKAIDHHHNHITEIELNNFKGVSEYVPTQNKAVIPIIQQIVNEIDENRWFSDVVTLSSWSRVTGSSDNIAAANWISSIMNGLGFDVTMPTFSLNGTSSHNIIGFKQGTTRPDDWYILGGHMDSRPYSGNAPGAVDNASGCAAVLEIAKIAKNYDFEGSLLFICYSGEEQGLYGSYAHVSQLQASGDDSKVKAALSMDMIGYTSNAEHDLTLESSSSNQWLIDLLAQSAATYSPEIRIFTTTNYWGSDHVPYIDNNMHGILLIDDDYGIYPAYHQSNDLPENINLNQAKYIMKTELAGLAELAGLLALASVQNEIFTNGFE